MYDPKNFVTDAVQLSKQTFDWGTLQWLCNGQLIRGAAQTFGLCTINPGTRNPRHLHPNCEEVLHMLSGARSSFV